jgi:hypothetical protein
MRTRTLIAASLVLFSAAAAADFVLVSKAYEVALADLRLPGTTGGTISFKECAACEYQTVRVTAETQYEANDRSLTLEDFRNELEQARNPRDVTVTVLHHLESDTVRAVRVRF